INGMSDFWVSPSVAAAFGVPVPNRPRPDGFVGINPTLDPGNVRISFILHEIGHAMVRFTSPGNRLFGNQKRPAYFSIDGVAKKVADWSEMTPSDFLPILTGPPNDQFVTSLLTPNDPLNDRPALVELGKLTTADIQVMLALGFKVGATAVMVLR